MSIFLASTFPGNALFVCPLTSGSNRHDTRRVIEEVNRLVQSDILSEGCIKGAALLKTLKYWDHPFTN